MASNASGQSTPSEYRPGDSFSIEDGGPGFSIGDFILVKIPKEIRVEGYVENEGTTVGTDLPLTSRGSSSQHFSSICQASKGPVCFSFDQ